MEHPCPRVLLQNNHSGGSAWRSQWGQPKRIGLTHAAVECECSKGIRPDLERSWAHGGIQRLWSHASYLFSVSLLMALRSMEGLEIGNLFPKNKVILWRLVKIVQIQLLSVWGAFMRRWGSRPNHELSSATSPFTESCADSALAFSHSHARNEVEGKYWGVLKTPPLMNTREATKSELCQNRSKDISAAWN